MAEEKERFLEYQNKELQRLGEEKTSELEEKNRELLIEACLERVRARTMAMQKSDELPEAANLLFQQMQTLGMPAWSAGYCTWDEDKKGVTLWMSSEGVIQPPFRAPLTEDPTFIHMREAYERGETLHVEAVGGDELVTHYRYMRTLPVVGQILDSIIDAGHPLPVFQIMHCAYFSQGFLLFITYETVPQAWDIFKRFSTVFDQTYTRFLDLKKAEAQAREALIELALDKVRSRTMAMQKSDELADAAYVLFQQLNNLGVTHERINIGIVKEEANALEFWVTEQGGNQINTRFSTSFSGPGSNSIVSDIYAGWKAAKKSMIVDITGEDLKAWLKYLTEVIGIPFNPAFKHNRRVQTVGYFSKGMLVLTTPEPLPEESIHLLEKFAGVFDLTYTRFNDLQLAEAQTHKANIEVALERVRARALAMQEPEELIEVAQVLRHEMGLLGVEELETASIYIHDDNADTADCWYAISDVRHPEKKLVADHITIDLRQSWVGRQMLDYYQSDKTQVSILMQGDNRREWIEYCSSVSTLLGGFYGEIIPDRTYHLYKFSNGAIGAASTGDISLESWELLSRTASVFSLAYSRFKDLTKARIDLQRLKEEKQRAELALTELKATQAQLVQAEKMASLGELTAGIAHEIQNPLNFVNNFSEVNAELSDEIIEAAGKGNIEDILLLAADIKLNQEKIREHGKRADAIVKGMLQHSRTSSGEKQPTDINALADEFLRLSYHGLRAKDKNFNATLKTEFDPTVGKIDIISQDIGRVLLNLINNAFYAVNERSKEAVNGYEPEVTVSTRLLTASENSQIRNPQSVIISVKDNGMGISEKVKEKIFQPFFTTKPTGQGTGLGLSLSYDIIKAHGGTIRVESHKDESGKEDPGTIFTIELPV